jgi:hypothetical protein
MQDPDHDAAEAARALNAHLLAMRNAALAIEEILGEWAQGWARSTIERAVAGDAARTRRLHSSGSYLQCMEELAALQAELPERIASGLRKNAWRHLYVDVFRIGTAGVMADLDYGIWQDNGYKLPPAYEPTVTKEFGRITQMLRKYGYRPDYGNTGLKHRYSVPPAAIAPMEAYYRLSLRLCDVVRTAEEARSRGADNATAGAWDGR